MATACGIALFVLRLIPPVKPLYSLLNVLRIISWNPLLIPHCTYDFGRRSEQMRRRLLAETHAMLGFQPSKVIKYVTVCRKFVTAYRAGATGALEENGLYFHECVAFLVLIRNTNYRNQIYESHDI